MKLFTCLLFVMAFCGTAIAGDRWDNCSNADGSVRLSDGELIVGDQGVIEYYGEAKVLSTVKEEETICELKDSGEKVKMYQNVITVEEITYALEEDGPASAMTEIMICQRGVGALVPPEMCKN